MRFDLIDAILELDEQRIVALKHVAAGEEYLQDHFPTYPVLPGVLMVETMAQSARRLLATRDAALSRHVLGRVRAMRFSGFVRPGQSLRVEVALAEANDAEQVFSFRGAGTILHPDATGAEPADAVAGRFEMRPIRLG